MLPRIEKLMAERRHVTFRGQVAHLKLDQLCKIEVNLGLEDEWTRKEV